MAASAKTLSTSACEDVILFTRAGDRLIVRPITAEDREKLVSFFHEIPATDLRFRFLATLKEVDGERIDEICRADYPAAMSFVAFCEGELVAIATLAGNDKGKVEVALTTLPVWKAHGISWTLLDHAIRFARERGAKEIVSIEHSDNRAAINLEHEMGFGIRILDAAAGEVMAVKSVS